MALTHIADVSYLNHSPPTGCCCMISLLSGVWINDLGVLQNRVHMFPNGDLKSTLNQI